jgi:hypothetical protein
MSEAVYVWRVFRPGEPTVLMLHLFDDEDVRALPAALEALKRLGYDAEPVYPPDLGPAFRLKAA